MPGDLPPLHALRAFEAVARRLSFKMAAEDLAVTPTAISHHIRQLEAHLGYRVLDRSPRSVALTAEGSTLYEATHSSFSAIRAAYAQLRQGRGPFRMTLSATAAFIGRWLVPRLEGLHREVPTLDLRLHASDTPVELRSGGVEVAIRYGGGPFAHGLALGQDEFAPVCSPSLRIRTVRDLRGAKLLHLEGLRRPQPPADWPRWCAQTQARGIDVRTGQRFPDSHLAIEAAIAGQGVLIVSRLLVRDALASGVLTAPFGHTLRGDSYYFVCAGELALHPRVAKLRNWFRATLAEGLKPVDR